MAINMFGSKRSFLVKSKEEPMKKKLTRKEEPMKKKLAEKNSMQYVLLVALLMSIIFALPANACYIGNYVWFDKNCNGIQDDDWIGIPGVTVRLFDPNGALLDETTTDAAGYYLLDDMGCGRNYRVEVDTPEGYMPTPMCSSDYNSSLDQDSNCSPAFVTLSSDSFALDYWNNYSIDFGFCLAEPGCSLTPGYWKTHSQYGPAPYNAIWAQVGEDTTFFLSGKSWYQVLWTSPKKGNAYYILAHAYIAAYMNALNGADTSAVTAQLAHAVTLFNAYTPANELAAAVRADFIATAGILDQYNNGVIGPGHCVETPVPGTLIQKLRSLF
jgi:hypothetical protein